MSDVHIPDEELVTVTAFLRNGDLIACPVGNGGILYRVRHDEVTGETDFDYEGVATLTGAHNTLRKHRSRG